MLVDCSDRGGTLADGGGHSLHRLRAEVTDGEESRVAGLEWQWPSTEPSPGLSEEVFGEGGIGQGESAIVESCATREPTRRRVRSPAGPPPITSRSKHR